MFPHLAQVLGAPLGFTWPGITCQNHLECLPRKQDTVVSKFLPCFAYLVCGLQDTGEYDDSDDDIAQLNK